jgi:hypothetical protein
MNVLIVGNFDVVERSRKIVFQHVGYWFDFFSGDTLFVAAEQQELILAPGEYHLYTDKHVDDPIPSGIHMPKVEPPRSCRLDQNYPNPFNPSTTIRFELSVAAELSLEIYNLAGQKIKTLFTGYRLSGQHVVLWDGCDEGGQTVAGGVYFCRLTTDSWSETIKMLFIR